MVRRAVSDSRADDAASAMPKSSLRTQVANARRYGWVVVAVVGVAVTAAVWMTTRQTPIYEASSTVLLRTSQTTPLFPFGSAVRQELFRQPETEQLYIDSETFQNAVRPSVPSGTSFDSSTSPNGTVKFTSRSVSPSDAAAAADLWATSYVSSRHQTVLTENTAALDFLQSTLDDLEAERAGIRKDVVALEAVLDRTEDPDQYARLLSQKVSIETQLQTQLAPVDQQIRDLSSQLANLDLLDRFLGDANISARVDRVASIPTDSVSPNLVRNVATAALLGVVLGAGLAYALAGLNDRVQDSIDVVTASGLPILGTIPHYRLKGDAIAEVVSHPTSVVSERYRAVVTALEFAQRTSPVSSLLISSAMPAEGKSTTAINLAVLISRHTSVLLVDADMRRPRLDRMLGVPLDLGLTDVLRGEVDYDDAIATVEYEGGTFDLLAVGSIVDDPTLLLRGERLGVLLDKLEGEYDLLVIDSAPILPVTDAALIGVHASASIIVSRQGKTSMEDVRTATNIMRDSGARLLGAVVNDDRSKHTNYRYASSPGRG